MTEGMAESRSVPISDQTCCQVPATEPPLAGPHERWCGRTGVSHPPPTRFREEYGWGIYNEAIRDYAFDEEWVPAGYDEAEYDDD